jgi:cytochrome c biogenesis protein CcdA/thiol-disulfide isomerase/thioredoxin
MNIALLITSFLAGILTVAAPCVLPLLPVIVGGSLMDEHRSRPLIISVSLALSVILFTLLLKVFTLFINVPQAFWTNFSATILILFGIFLIFPSAWDWLSEKLGFSKNSEQMMQKASSKHSFWGAVLLGASLGPVFSSCSPTYFVILATVLPVSLFEGLIYLFTYALGLALVLWLVSLLGRKLTKGLKFAANPRGWFKRILGILLILVGLAISFGLDKQAESYFIEHGFGSTSIERTLLKDSNLHQKQSKKQAVDMPTTSTAAVTTSTTAVSEGPVMDWNDDNAGTFANFGPAPELAGLTNWINSNPLTLQSLRGKVVIIDFWTYSCINCIRTLPYLEAWAQKYSGKGLVIIGVSDPEFQFEKKYENVLAAVRKNGLTYPIALDNDHATWNAYNNEYWPAKYIIDQNGNLRYYHFGEGNYAETEEIIQKLLNENDQPLVSNQVKGVTVGSMFLTNETYLGSYRRDSITSWDSNLSNGEWAINNDWDDSNPEHITTTQSGAALKLSFYAANANLVLDGIGTARVLVDGQPLVANAGSDVKNGVLTLNGARLYQLTNFGNSYHQHVIEIIFNEAGVKAYSWTFG